VSRLATALIAIAGIIGGNAGVANGSEPAAPVGPAKVSITIYASNGAPREIVFDDATNEERLLPERDYFVGFRPADPPRSYPLFVRYDGDGEREIPLLLRVTPGMAPISLQVYKPSYSSCPGDVELIRLSNLARSTQSTGGTIETMLRARRFYALCPETGGGKRVAAQIYFTLNCQLAKRHPFFDITDDAKNWFINSERTDAARTANKRAVTDCENAIRARSVQQIFAYQRTLLSRRSFAEFKSVNATLAALATDPDWQPGFAAAQIDEPVQQVDQLRIAGLYRELGAASDHGDAPLALTLNQQLIDLERSGEHDKSFAAIGVTNALLTANSTWLSARSTAATQAGPP